MNLQFAHGHFKNQNIRLGGGCTQAGRCCSGPCSHSRAKPSTRQGTGCSAVQPGRADGVSRHWGGLADAHGCRAAGLAQNAYTGLTWGGLRNSADACCVFVLKTDEAGCAWNGAYPLTWLDGPVLDHLISRVFGSSTHPNFWVSALFRQWRGIPQFEGCRPSRTCLRCSHTCEGRGYRQ